MSIKAKPIIKFIVPQIRN